MTSTLPIRVLRPAFAVACLALMLGVLVLLCSGAERTIGLGLSYEDLCEGGYLEDSPLVLDPNCGVHSEHSIQVLQQWMRQAIDDD